MMFMGTVIYVHMKKSVVSDMKAKSSAGLDLVPEVKYGLPVGEFDVLRDMFDLSDAELAPKLGISVPTLYRRRQEKGRLDPESSDKVIRFARLFGMALEFFNGDEPAARRWFSRPAPALGGVRPLEMAETEIGARLVEQLIGRLEYGVYT